MAKTNKSLFQNKKFGHLVAVLFYAFMLYGLFMAATKMNYIWKWTSVPTYFAYEKIISVDAPFDGVVSVKENNTIVLSNDETSKEIKIPKGYKLKVESGDELSEFDIIASTQEWAAGPLLTGLGTTLQISGFAISLAFVLAITLAFMRISRYQFLKDIATVYITVIRGTPLLVQLFIFYFIVATIFDIERFFAGAISLGLFYGAYIAEVLRGAIQSIDKGQTEAAKSLGMGYLQTMAYIIMPQALKRALPTLVGESIALVKDSSLVSVISITDLTKVGREIVANTFSPFETWLIVAAIYFSITAIMSIIGSRLEKRMSSQGGM